MQKTANQNPAMNKIINKVKCRTALVRHLLLLTVSIICAIIFYIKGDFFMQNFEFFTPTKILFGKGAVADLPTEIKRYTNRVLLTYGGGSVKRLGIYDTVTNLLKQNGIEYIELSGIEPNPKVESVELGAKLCRDNNLGGVLALGGGSTIDCSKVIAGAVGYNGNAWDIVLNPDKIKSVLPIFTVLTLSATGSEMNGNAVISNMQSNDKKGVYHIDFKPKCSVLDPEYTFSVSPWQTASGTADIMSHIFETYFNKTKGTMVQDNIAEGLLKVCIENGKKAFDNPTDYTARANLMWASSLAINGLTGMGKSGAWSCHAMEHQLSAYYDITHGAGLATLTPAWFEYVLNHDTVDKFKSYGVNVWGIDSSLDKYEIANKAIEKTKNFLFNDLKLPKTLKEYGIDETYLEIMAEKAANEGLKYAYKPLEKKDVLAIYMSCLG